MSEATSHKTMRKVSDLEFSFPDRTDEEWAALEKEWRKEEDARIHKERLGILKGIRPSIFAETTRERLPVSSERIEKVMNWNPRGSQGLLLHGETGQGKTRLVFMLVEKLVMEFGFRPLYYTTDKLARELGESYLRKGHDDLLRKLFRWRILILDDLGKEKPTARWEEDLFAIIRERTDRGKPVIVTTNFVGEGLISRFSDPELGKPLVRRLREFCQAISC